MLVKDAMTAPGALLSEEMTVRDAAVVLVRHGEIAAPVVDESGVLRGIVTEIDLIRDRFEPDPRATARPAPESDTEPPRTVGEVMTRSVVTTAEHADVAELAERMVADRIRVVPVLRAGRVVGMLGRGDLLRVHARTDEEVSAEIVEALAEGGPYLHGWDVRVRDGIVHLTGRGQEADRRLAARIARTVAGVSRVVVDSG